MALPKSVRWGLPVVMILAVLLTRVWWVDGGIWNLDEGATFTMAQQVLEGDVLYRDAADHRSPLMPYLKAMVFAVFGDWNTTAVYLILALLLGWCAAALGWIGTRLDNSITGWAAGFVFVALQFLLVDANDAMSANTEWFVVIFSTAAFLLMSRSLEDPGFKKGLPIGILFGLSMLCKQPGLLDAIVAAILLVLLMLAKESPRKRLAWMVIGLMVGVALPMGVTALYFVYHGAYADYVFYAFTFNTTVYIPEVPLEERLIAARMPFVLAWANTPWIGAVGISAALLAIWVVFRDLVSGLKVRQNLLLWLFLGWTAAGIVTTGLSGREFSHYSQQVIPGLSLAAGWLLARLWCWRPTRLAKLGPVVVTVLVAGALVSGWTKAKQSAQGLSRIGYGESALANEVAAHSTPEERIFIWGYFPELYLNSKRLPATRYVYANFITGMVAWTNLDAFTDVEYAVAPNAWEKFYEDFDAMPPAMIVDTSGLRGYTKFPLRNRKPLWSEVIGNYAQVSCKPDDYFNPRLFRRLSPITESPTRERKTDFDHGLKLVGANSNLENSTPQLAFTAPVGFDRLELIAHREVVAVLDHPVAKKVSVRFFVPRGEHDRTKMWVRASGPGKLEESEVFNFERFETQIRSKVPTQFPLKIGSYNAFPTSISSNHGSLSLYKPEPETWTLVAPARLRYDLPASIDRITFSHGMKPGLYFKSDGYDITIRWLPKDGAPMQIWRERFQPNREGKHQKTQNESVSLPPRGPGKLEIHITSGEKSSPDFDHLFLGRLVAHSVTPDISLGDRLVMAAPIEDGNFIRREDGSWILHAPTQVRWPRPPALSHLSFDFGINPGAYDPNQTGQTDGVRFTMQLVDEMGESVELFDRTLRPATVPEDGGIQSAALELPAQPQGELVMTIGAGDHDSNAWDWAWAGNFIGETVGPKIEITPYRRIETEGSASQDGEWIQELESGHWNAHAPHTLVYSKPADLMAVTFQYGLPDNAVRDEAGNRLSNGISISVSLTAEDGTTVELFDRHLDPYTRPEDAGIQQSTVQLPAGETGSLIFRLGPGPDENAAFDWSYWGAFSGEVVAELPLDQSEL